MTVPGSRARQVSSDAEQLETVGARDHTKRLWWVVVIAVPLVICAAVYAVYPQAIAPSHVAACGGTFHGPGPRKDMTVVHRDHGLQRVGTYRWAGIVAMPVWADSTCTDVYVQLPGRGSAAVYFNEAQG